MTIDMWILMNKMKHSELGGEYIREMTLKLWKNGTVCVGFGKNASIVSRTDRPLFFEKKEEAKLFKKALDKMRTEHGLKKENFYPVRAVFSF